MIQTMSFFRSRSVTIVAVLFLTSSGSLATAADLRDFGEDGLHIIAPADGSTVAPGEIVNFKVEVVPEALPGFVAVFSDRKSFYEPFSGRLDGPPFEGPIEISKSASGLVEVEVVLIHPDEGAIAGRSITLNVVSSESPQWIETTSLFHFEAPSSEIADLRSRLKVTGYFEGNVRRDISGPQFGTTYATLTPNIVGVASDGRLTANRPGFGFIAVENGSHRQYSEVIVEEADGDWPPPEDKTSSFTIQASGFRRDPQSGFFVQQLTLRNTSNVPLPKAIHLIIDGLPEGVELKHTYGSAKPPLTGKLVLVEVKSENFLSPGETATATLKFTNRDGVPITYSKKVYCGGNP